MEQCNLQFNEQLSRIKIKLSSLKKADKKLFRRPRVFGAKVHGYKLNPCLTLADLDMFEQAHGIVLPPEYAAFITQVGNGGAGPFYGITPLADSICRDPNNISTQVQHVPSVPFPHTQAWNINFQPDVDQHHTDYSRQYREFEEIYFDSKWMTGVLPICDFGCGITLCLVVNGEEYGNIWVDDRVSDNGIYPSHELGNEAHVSFLNWYECWLDKSLKEVGFRHKN